ncbi:MAG: GNAT family N-acetyltransferase [Chloroflexi bacterium]|nr:GNAT family N-acetyltransferase [Chloroflexota bacterium]
MHTIHSLLKESEIENPAFIIRYAVKEDEDRIRDLIRSSSVHSRRRKKKTMRNKKARRGFLSKVLSPIYSSGKDWHEFIIAETKDGELIGCARIRQHKDNIREVATVAVDKTWRGKGISNAGGKFIINNFPRPLWGTCLNNLVPFYKRFGAVEIIDQKEMPSFLRRRQRWFNLLLRLFRSNKRLAVIVLPE